MEGAIGKTKVVIIVPIALLASSISWMAMRILLQRNRRTKRMMRVSTMQERGHLWVNIRIWEGTLV